LAVTVTNFARAAKEEYKIDGMTEVQALGHIHYFPLFQNALFYSLATTNTLGIYMRRAKLCSDDVHTMSSKYVEVANKHMINDMKELSDELTAYELTSFPRSI
jgi:hypothetical protein